MSQATEILAASRAPHTRIVGVVSAAHFVSHYYIILLAPLLPFVRADYGVSYTEIGLALAAFNIVSAALQTPAGFLVDWLGARVLLIAGLVIGAGAFMIVGLTHTRCYRTMCRPTASARPSRCTHSPACWGPRWRRRAS
jgi:MFS family permease